MNIRQIIDRAASYCDDSITNTLGILAVNEALDKLGDMGLVYDSTIVTAASDDAWVDLPATLTSLVSITDSEGKAVNSYVQRGMQLRLPIAGDYIIGYRKHPDHIANEKDTPPVHQSYHDVLCTYLKGWWKLRDDEDSADGLRMMQKFEADAGRVFSILRRQRRGASWVVDRAAVIG